MIIKKQNGWLQMKRNVLIIDNNAEHVDRISKLALEVTKDIEIYVAYNLADAYKLLMEITIDVFVLDTSLDRIQPDDTSGIGLIEKVRKIPKYVLTPVIFITMESDPELYAYRELNCIGYIIKPVSATEFKKIFIRAVLNRTRRESDKMMVIRQGGLLYPLKVSDIVYTENIEHVLYIHLKDGTIHYVPYKSCSKFLMEADVDCFIHCSRGVLVNRIWVQSINLGKNIIHLKNDMGNLIIGRTYKKTVRDEILYKSRF